MTVALCLSCGETKFGALCPCLRCKAEATGNADLDIAFSDHALTVQTLKRLGDVIKQINQAAETRDICTPAFLVYVSRLPDSPLMFEPPEAAAVAIQALLDRVNPAAVTIEAVRRKTSELPEATPGPPAVELPPAYASAFRAAFSRRMMGGSLGGMSVVEVQMRDGKVRRPAVLQVAGEGTPALLTVRYGPPFVAGDVIAVRPTAGCLSLFGREKWLKVEG